VRWVLAALILLPAAVFGQVPNYRPGQSPQITSTVASGGDGLRLVQGAGVCFNSTTCTTRISYDGTDFIIDVPSSKGFQVEVNGTDALTLSSAGVLTATGKLASSVTSGVAVQVEQGATASFNGSTNTVSLSYDGTEFYRDVPSGKRHYWRVNGTERMNLSAGTLFVNDTVNAASFLTSGGQRVKIRGNDASDGAGLGVALANGTSLTTDGDRIAAFYSDDVTTDKASVFRDGAYSYNTGGTDDVAGRATLVGGTVTVSTTAVETTDIIQLTRCVTGGTEGHLSVGTVTADTSFIINSSSGTDTSTICWTIGHAY
jgi:hypothetical protein